MNPFDEMNGIFQAQVLLLRRANWERAVMEAALQHIASGERAPAFAQATAMEALITIGKLRTNDLPLPAETPEDGLAVHFAERRDFSEQLRDLRERAVQGGVLASAFIMPYESVHNAEVKEELNAISKAT